MSAANQSGPVLRYFVPGEFFVVLETKARGIRADKDAILTAMDQSFLSQIFGDDENDKRPDRSRERDVDFLDGFQQAVEKQYEDGKVLTEVVASDEAGDPVTKTKEVYKDKRLDEIMPIEEARDVVTKTKEAKKEIRSNLDAALSRLNKDSVVLAENRAYVFIQVQKGSLLDDSTLACFTGALELQARRKPKIGSYTMLSASPNWLIASSQGNLTTGGPGAWPVAPSIEAGEVLTADDYGFSDEPAEVVTSGKGVTGALKRKAQTTTVTVYILDTVPKYEQLSGAVKQWREKNELIKQLLGSRFKPSENRKKHVSDLLTLHYYEGQDRDKVFTAPLDYGIDDHDYEMPDHGLFIAGIIHAQAECARLHMIQVLNDYGVGSIQTLLWGLEEVRRARQEGEKVVVNCSLTFSADERAFADGKRPIGKFLSVYHLALGGTRNGSAVAPYMEELERLFNHLARDAFVFAAAGNDSRPGELAVPAKYPAAFAKVRGVGALGSDREHAPYSNRADEPLTDGYLTVGGDVQTPEPSPIDPDVKITKASPISGLLSIYTNDQYPHKTGNNSSGWARWAGTSFATAVVAGAYAKQLCEDRDVKDLEKDRYKEDERQPLHLKRRQRRRAR